MHTDLHRGGGIQTCIEREYNQTCTEAYRLAQRNTDRLTQRWRNTLGQRRNTDSHRGIQTRIEEEEYKQTCTEEECRCTSLYLQTMQNFPLYLQTMQNFPVPY